jgi:hypothetical protein
VIGIVACWFRSHDCTPFHGLYDGSHRVRHVSTILEARGVAGVEVKCIRQKQELWLK